MDVQLTRTGSRVAALDSLRGITIIFVVLGHSWIVFPQEAIDRIPVLRALFNGGAVTMFFVIGGFIVTATLLREQDRGVLDPIRFYLRRIVRVGVQLVPLAVAILLMTRFDATDLTPEATTNRSLVTVMTHTWNNYLVDNALEARSDLGHLWYLSVQQQVYLLLPLAVILFGRHRRIFAALVAVTAVGVVVHRYTLLGQAGGEWPASLLTTSRADALLLGALVAVLLPRLGALRRLDQWLVPGCLVTLGVLMIVLPELAADQYLREWGIGFTLVSTLLVATIAQEGSRSDAQGASLAERLLQSSILRWLGNASLALFVWHYPIFWFVSRHTEGDSTVSRIVLAAALLAITTVLAQRFIEEPSRRWLRDSTWFRARVTSTKAGQSGLESEIR